MNTAIKVMMMPKDTNVNNTIFGGVILSYLDQAGAIVAKEHLNRYIEELPNKTRAQISFQSGTVPQIKHVTVAMEKVEFHQPVFVGDIVSFNGEVIKIGKSSCTVKIQVLAQRFNNLSNTVNVTEAIVTYVAITASGNPIEIFEIFSHAKI